MGISANFELSLRPEANRDLRNVSKQTVNAVARTAKNPRDLAQKLQRQMEEAFGEGWHVLIGNDFAVDIRYRRGGCVLLVNKKDKLKLLLYRTTTQANPRPTNVHHALKAYDPETFVPSRKLKATVYESDMSDGIKQKVMQTLRFLVEEFNGDEAAPAKIAETIKHALTKDYGPTWHTAVSPTRDMCLIPRCIPGTHLDVALDKTRIVVYAHDGIKADANMDLARLLNAFSLIVGLICFVLMGYITYTKPENHDECLGLEEDNLRKGCTQAEVDAAGSRRLWENVTFYGATGCAVFAAMLRMFLGILRTKFKHD